MIKHKLVDEINDQIQAEFQAAYLYLAYSAWFEVRNLEGFAHWMKMQWQEELEHGMKFYNHLLRREAEVELQDLEAPSITAQSPVEVFEQVLEHERNITKRIHKLYDMAVREDDYPLQTLLNWFIDEQVEEEEVTASILGKLKIAGGEGAAMFVLDRDLAERGVDE